MPVPTTYTYPLSAIQNSSSVRPGRLEFEIEQSSIITQIDPDGGILNNAGIVTIKFKDVLSLADKTTLDGGLTQTEENPAIAGSILAQSNLNDLLDEPPQEVSLVQNTEVKLAQNTQVVVTGATIEGGTIATTADQRYEKWTVPELALNGSFQTVWQKTQDDMALYEALFHVSSDRVEVRLEVDGAETALMDLQELGNAYFLSTTGSSDVEAFGWAEYQTNRWRFRPTVPLRVNTEIIIQMRSTQGNKTLYRGISVWGPR